MQDTVTQERWKYIGGSDIPAIMGISRFKTRWQLLQEKAQIIEPEFKGNVYTDYGNTMEPKIREFVNSAYRRNFVEGMDIFGDLRFHYDGIDNFRMEILEIKTTSEIHDNLNDYKEYLVQLLEYMEKSGCKKGYLAVYERPEDFSEEFNPSLLAFYPVFISDYSDFLAEINKEIDRFRTDLEKLRENPFITEEELQPNEVVEVANRVLVLEQSIALMKKTEKELKSAKAELKRLMEENNIKKWETPSGIKITLVPDGDDTIVSAFNEERFKAEQPELYHSYLEDRMKPGRAGYVRISVPK